MRRFEGPAYSKSQAPDVPLEFFGNPPAATPRHFVDNAFVYHRPSRFGVDDGGSIYPATRQRDHGLAGGCTTQDLRSLTLRLNAIYKAKGGRPGHPVTATYPELQKAMHPELKTMHDLSRASIALPLFFLQYGVCLHDFVTMSLGPGKGKHNAMANRKVFTISRRLPTCKPDYDKVADWKRAEDLDAHYHEVARLARETSGYSAEEHLAKILNLPMRDVLKGYFDWLRKDDDGLEAA